MGPNMPPLRIQIVFISIDFGGILRSWLTWIVPTEGINNRNPHEAIRVILKLND
jgi:hypothetical protein